MEYLLRTTDFMENIFYTKVVQLTNTYRYTLFYLISRHLVNINCKLPTDEHNQDIGI